MPESSVPNLLPTAAATITVDTAKGLIPTTPDGPLFQYAVVQKLPGIERELGTLHVSEQSPAFGAKLTTGEVMHLYVAGGGGSSTAMAIAVAELVVIVGLVAYIFIYCR